jgi:oxygen-dependent protoporphyrinogen oxidase
MAGLSAAYRLREAGLVPTVFEANDRVGGRIWTIRKGDYLMDLGAAVYLGTYRDAMALMRELGLEGQLRERPAIGAMPRDGKVHYFDYSTPIRTALRTGAISPAGKLKAIKLARLLLKHRGDLGYNDYTKIVELDTETTREYSVRELSPELQAYATEPLVRGTWAADDAESSNALMLWSIRNMLVPTVFNLDSGMDALAREIATLVDVRLERPVRNVTDCGSHVEVTHAGVDGERTDRFDGCVIATTANPALAMFPQMDANHRDLYETARYRGLIAVALGLGRRPTDRATYILLPQREDPDVIAVIADHIKAAGRVPEGKSMYTLLFSHEYLHRNAERSDADVLADAIACVGRYHGDVSDAVEEHAIVRWEEVVPVVDTGRFRRIARFKEGLDPTARVQFASDLDRIPGVNGALVSGAEAAARIIGGRGAWSAARAAQAAPEKLGVGD